MRIFVLNSVRAPVKPGHIRRPIEAAAGVREVARKVPHEAEVVVRIGGDRLLRSLNREHLGHDAVTDVLSFPGGAALPGTPAAHLGDIAISWPAVRRQAAEHGHSAEAELALLAVHGFLHLLGWDHALASEERAMTRLTLAALDAAGVHLSPGRLRAGAAGAPSP